MADEKWWESSPMADTQQADGEKWWESSPLAEPAQAPVTKPKEQGLLSTLAEGVTDVVKRASGAAISGVASIPEAVQSSARAGVRSGASGEPTSVMPGGVFIPGVDTDEAINGPMDGADKAKRELGAERLALNVKVPFAGAIAKAGKETQEDINKTTSQATQDAVANSQISGNLLKGEIDFGKDPSVRGLLMQGADVFGSMFPTVATALVTRSPGAAGAVGGAMAAGEGVGNARDFIAKQTHEQLLEHSPIYKRMVDAGASPEEARSITSARAEDTAALMQGAVASVGDRFTGKLVTGGFDKLLTRAAGKSVMGRAAAGAAVSGLEEGTQELSEGIASDLGIKSVAGNKEVGEDSAANFVLGALGGSAPGAGRGVVSGVKDRLADRAASKQTGDAAPSPSAPAAPPAPASPAPSSTEAVSPAPAQPQADGQAAAGAAGQTQQVPAGVPEEVARAQNPDGAPETMSPELAETRLAELELEASTTGLNPVQDAERQALAERVAVDRAQELDAEAIGVPVDQVSAPGAEQGAARAAAENEAAPAPAAGVESAAKESTARTWPQFVLEQGERVSELKKGTPRWNELKASWDALKISRAGQDAEGTGAAGEPKAEIQNRDRSRPASVIQMQGMAANPDYMRLGVSRSPESGAPMVFAVGDQAQAAVATGRGDTAVMSDGQRVPFQYAVMEAADVQPSNFADGAVNPLFDSVHPGTVKALNNGRTAGLRAAYERGTADGYKRELMADSDMHGIDPAVIAGMKAPMLVRVYSEGDNRTNMGAKSQSQALGLSASEQAATDAALMDNSVVDAFATGALDSAANRDFARAFIGKLQAAGQDVAGMMDANGALSPAGVTRLQAGLVHKAYGDGDLVESLFGSTDNDIRAIGEALKDVAGEWANLRSSVEAGAINPEVDVTANLLQAIRVVQKARRERGSLHDAINQVDMVTGDVLDPLTVGMLRLLYTGHYLTRATGRERLTESLRDYMASALATSAHGDMFGEQVGPTDILNALSGPTAQTQNEPTPAQQEQSATPQGERVAPGRDPAGVRADEAGPGQSGSNPDRAGQEAAETGGRGQGQDAENSGEQQNGQGDKGTGQDSSGPVKAAEAAAYGAANKLVSADRAAELREKLKKKLGQLNSGIDPEMLAIGAELAVFHIEAGARKFTDFVKAISADLDAPVSKIRPYLRSWYNGARDMMEDSNLPVDGMDSPQAVRDALAGLENSPVEAKDNATSTRTSVERDSQEPAPGSILAGGDERGSRADGPADRNEGGRVRGEVQQGKQGDPRIPPRRPVIDGERSDQRVHLGDAIPELASIATGSDFRERGSDVGIGRIPVERIPTGTVAKSAAASPETAAATPSKRSAVGKPLARGIDSVRETLPMLLPGQQEDVVKAEARFDKPNGYGMLFTNGTGTGKTYTGLGVVARQVQQGKSNILILAPDAKVLNDWIESGDKLGVSLTALVDTKDAGQGVVATTYANAGQNQALASRKWDMVVADEAHKLMQSEDARETDALRMVRALTLHPDGAWTRHYAVNAGKLDEVSKLRGELKDAEAAGAAPAAIAQLQKKIDALDAELRDLHEQQKAHIADKQGASRPRALFLSATPFAYEKTVDWANGYLFDYPQSEGSAYNSGDGREQFMMQHFGYRMRYNKLTAPEAGVDSGLMQRNFNTWLRREGVLSSRVLDVDADYDRRFVLIDSDLGNRIDEVFRWIDDQARSEKNDSATFHSLRKLVQGSFDYLSRRYLLEAIKAEHSIPYVKKQLELGRKAVVFHDYKKGGGFNPFDVAASQLADYSSMPVERRALLDDAVRGFRKEFADLIQSGLDKMQSPIEAYKKAFGDQVLLVNGDEKAKALLERYKRFNNDQEAPAVLLVQSAKNAGWSGHDTTGKYQRVLVNLGQPSAPTMAIQQEGRIYRTGQVSDAIIRYFNTGTSWEKHTFAGTIAGRASAAENLSLGEEARALKDAFIQAFEESDYYEPGHEGEGKGGKARDRQINGALTEWDRAKAYYFGTQKKTARTKAQEGKDYFATPEPVGLKMVQWADMRPGEDALEPSAGHGAIARWFPDAVKRTVVEPSSTLRARLALNINPAEDRVVDGVFEDLAKTNKYDSIVMNPPFGIGGKTAMEHVAKAWAHLRDGGRLVALIPTGPAADKRLNEWLYGVNEKGQTNNPDAMLMADVALPQVAFERAGTAVAARILVLEKQTSQDKRAGYPAARQIDLTKVDSIQKLFDRLEAIEMRGRTQKALPVAEQAKAIHQARPAPQVNAPAEPKTVRGDEPIEEYVTAKGKPIRGIWRAGLTKEQAQAIDPYTFQKGGKWFLRERHLPAESITQDAKPAFSRSASAAPQPNTEAFKRWFGDSKVVDADGKPLVMYHGTSGSQNGEAFTSFDVYASNYGLMGMGGYFTADPAVASSYTEKGKGTTPTVYPVLLSIKNPLDMDAAADAAAWKKQFPDADGFHEGGTSNESWYRAAEESVQDQGLPRWEGAEVMQDGLRAMGFDGITHIGGGRVKADGVKHQVFIAFEPEQIKSATGNNGRFDPANPDIRFSRSNATQQAYETRIDELFAGGRPALDGVRVLDRSDIFGLLGINEKPVQLAEGKVRAGMKNHPRMTADLWKKVPSWLDNPAAVFESDTVPGRLVVVAPETLGNDQVLMVLDPDAVGSDPSLKLNLLINAYDKDGGPPPYMRWLASGLGRYVDKQKFPTVLKASGLQLPSTALQNKPGTNKILTEKNLSGYRKANAPVDPALSRGAVSQENQAVARVQSMVDAITKTWANAPEVIVARDMQDDKVPQAVRDYDASMRSEGEIGAPEGFFYGGRVYLVTSQLHTPVDTIRVLFHESLGHFGLRGLYGTSLDAVLDNVVRSKRAAVIAKARDYRFVGEGIDVETASNAEVWASMSRANRLHAAEEVLAEMAQSYPELGYVRRSVAVIRQWLRKHVPGLDAMRMTDDEIIHSYLLPARGFVERGRAGGAAVAGQLGAPAFSRGASSQPQLNGKLAQLQGKVKDLMAPDRIDTWLYHWQDKFIDLKRIQEQIKALNGTVSETNDAYRGEELYHKRVAKRAANFLRDEVRPLMKAMNDAGVGIEEFERYLHARHAAEANKAMAERNPSQHELVANRATADQTVTDLRNRLQRAQAQGLATVAIQKALGQALIEKADWDGAQAFNGTEDQRLSLSGMSDQEAAKILASYTGDSKKAIEGLGARVDQMNEGTLRTLDDYGLMDKATLNAWRSAYQHYVPLHRDEANPDSKAHPIGQGFSTKGDAAKKRTGSNEKVTNILSHIVMQREAALTRGEKNNVVKRLYLLAAQNPDASLWGLDLPKKKVLDPDTGLVRTVADPAARLKDNVVAFRVGGKDKYLVFNERNERAARLALAVKNMDATELDWLSRTMGHATRWMAAVNTQYNPVFSVFNIMRDLQGASLQLSDTKLAGKQKDVLANIAKNTGKIWAELRRERKEEGAGTGPWAQLMEQFQLDGGTTGFRELYSDPADRLKALQKELRKGTQGAAAKGASFALGVLSDFNESLEMTTRLATYKVALDNGLSRQEAASLAKNITVNFNRKGRVTSVLGSHYAFLNAAIQGNARLLQTMTGPAGRKIALGGVGLGVMMALMGQLMMGGGDGADDEWKKIPEFVKERNIIIPLSRTQYVTIPMPLGFHVLPNLGRKMVDAAFHNDPTVSRAKYVGDMAAIALNAYNPFGGSDNMMQMFTPTWADPAIALATNKDWMGKSIFKEVRDINHPTPGHARVKDATALPYRWAARGINAATGGSEWEQGAISPTPEAIQYLVEQAFGGVLREANKLGATATAAATGEELAPHQWFLAGRVYGNTTGMNGQSGTYYDNTKRINVALAEAKARVERGENVDAVLKDMPLAKAAGVEKLADKRVSDLTKLRRKVQASDLPDKKDQVKAINKEIESTMRLLNQAVAEVVKQPS